MTEPTAVPAADPAPDPAAGPATTAAAAPTTAATPALRHLDLPADPVEIAPDGSEVRPLLAAAGGSLAHFRLPAGLVSHAVRHRTVTELWYVLAGAGRLWRRWPTPHGEPIESIVELLPGRSIELVVGVEFQFRADGEQALELLGATLPAWPGEGEAVAVAQGAWPATA